MKINIKYYAQSLTFKKTLQIKYHGKEIPLIKP